MVDAVDRSTALAAGTAVHRVLEELDLDALVRDAERTRWRPRASVCPGSSSRRSRPAADRPGKQPATPPPSWPTPSSTASPSARSSSACGRSPPRRAPSWPASSPSWRVPRTSDHGPLAYLAGSVDLLYRDPATGLPVVADYKTDRIEDDDALARARPRLRPPGPHLRPRPPRSPRPPRAPESRALVPLAGPGDRGRVSRDLRARRATDKLIIRHIVVYGNMINR